MKKVLIVDDEPLVRVAFKTLVDWKEIGFDIYAEASTGAEALEILAASPADIVITDIKMPVMDGLALTRWIKEKLPDTIVAVLSCYDEFMLVKEAFKLGAFDYMLKTEINGESLVDLLKRAERVFNEHKENIASGSLNNKLVKKNLDKLKEGFFKNLIWNKANGDKLLESEIKELNLRLRNKRNYIGVFKTDDISTVKEIYGDDGQELFVISVLNIVNETLDEYNLGDVFSNTPEEYVIVFTFSDNKGARTEREMLQAASGKIINTINKNIGITISCGISGAACNVYNRLHPLYKQALNACDYRFIHGKRKVIFYEDVAGIESNLVLNHEEALTRLKNYFRTMDVRNMKVLSESILIRNKNINKEDYTKVKFLYDEYFTILLDQIRKQGSIENMKGSLQRYYEYIRVSGTIDEYNDWIEEIIKMLNEDVSDEPFMVKRAKQFIYDHFAEAISLKDAAEHLKVSEEHLSREFSRNAGCNFTRFLMQVKVEKAKEYLRNTDLKAWQIAEKVGYTNAGTLFKIFKKITGYTLSDYKGSKVE